MTSRTLLRLALAGAVAAGGLALAPPVTASPQSAAVPHSTIPVRLLTINDLHGNLETPSGSSGRITDENGVVVEGAGGVARLATKIKELRTRNTMLVAAGDLIGASPLVSAAYHDEPTLEILDRLGLRASSAGNHEFDEGYAELQRLMKGGCHPTDGCSPAGEWEGTSFDFLAANVLKEGSGRYALPPFYVKSVNGVKVGFIGLVTQTTPTIVTAEGIKGLRFTEEVEAANKVSRFLARRGVKAQVVLVHEGDQVTQGQSPDACPVVEGAGSRIAKNLDPQIDLVISGHSHQAYICRTTDPAGQPRYYTQGSSFGRVLTQIDLQVDRRTRDVVRSTVTADNHVIRPTITPDAEIAAAVATWKERSAAVANRPLGRITADISNAVNNTSPQLANPETPLGNLIADSQLAAAQPAGAQVALMNPGGIRAPLTYAQSGSEGDGVVTYGEAFTVQPFGNIVQVRTYTGAQLKALLEQQVWSVAANGTVTHRILQVSSSLTYTFDTTKPVGSRVSDIKINGTPVTDGQSVRIAANNFLMGGGDGFTVFTQGTDLWSGPIDLDAFGAYLTAHSPVAPPATGRITFVK
ncbi:bifunctional metallophosphatase/5'-nucleotidase [Thermoactinospora rubra]|uniref:bifunctional metallophosphatase/5'-nucleotidase n=1 Tax=Thermoactinospora rubra TaxID=1088767 RepID=UPI000A103222|nr:bifunctional metallophosphatase/5'-nucleotidase [Thermoactinospora rubra]